MAIGIIRVIGRLAQRKSVGSAAQPHQMIRHSIFSKTIAKLLLALVFVLAGHTLHAEVMLSEIMYNPQNGGANRDWVELYNSGSSAVSLSGWQFGLPTNNVWTSALPAGTSLGESQGPLPTPRGATPPSVWGSGIYPPP